MDKTMSKFTFPPVIIQALLFGLVTILQYFLDNFGLLNIPPVYAPVISLVITTAVTLIKEALPKTEPVAQARGMGEVQPQSDSYLKRVLVG